MTEEAEKVEADDILSPCYAETCRQLQISKTFLLFSAYTRLVESILKENVIRKRKSESIMMKKFMTKYSEYNFLCYYRNSSRYIGKNSHEMPSFI